MISLNELGAATSLAAVPIPKLLNLAEDDRKYFRAASLKLLRSVGSVDVLRAEEMWQEMRSRANVSRSDKTENGVHS